MFAETTIRGAVSGSSAWRGHTVAAATASHRRPRHAALLQKVKLLKNPKGKHAIHRAIVRRVLAVTLIVAGVSMLMSGIGSVLVH